jgi:hypothetical protein
MRSLAEYVLIHGKPSRTLDNICRIHKEVIKKYTKCVIGNGSNFNTALDDLLFALCFFHDVEPSEAEERIFFYVGRKNGY